MCVGLRHGAHTVPILSLADHRGPPPGNLEKGSNSNGWKKKKTQMSSVENPGWLFDIGDYTTQLYGDYNKPL